MQFIFGEQGDEQAQAMKKLFKGKYYYIPQGVKKSTIEYIKSQKLDKKYAYDIVFIGAKLSKKKWINEKIIPTLQKKYKVYLHGQGWKKRDFFFKALHKIGKLSNLKILSLISQKFYTVINEKEEAKLYRNSKICINFHERDQDGNKSHRIINQRLFKIAGCGGIQIVDKDKLIDDQFPCEFIMQEDLNVKAWLSKIEDLMKIDNEELELLRKKIIDFTFEKHTTQLRAKTIIDLTILKDKITNS